MLYQILVKELNIVVALINIYLFLIKKLILKKQKLGSLIMSAYKYFDKLVGYSYQLAQTSRSCLNKAKPVKFQWFLFQLEKAIFIDKEMYD